MKSAQLKGIIDKTARRIARGASDAASSVAAVSDSFTNAVQGGVDSVADTVQDARTRVANVISSTGNVLGITTVVVGEVALFSAGVVPLLIFGGLPIKFGEDISGAIESMAKLVRGSKPQFIGVNRAQSMIPFMNDDILAIIYDPYMPHQDNGGYVQLAEEEIIRQLRLMTETREEREFQYILALVSVQELKRKHGIAFATRDIRFTPPEQITELALKGPV